MPMALIVSLCGNVLFSKTMGLKYTVVSTIKHNTANTWGSQIFVGIFIQKQFTGSVFRPARP